ncbi:aromatic ring-hydroxylating oxygenase subunit alpha [Rhodococcus artemisiae]|uniref:Aromatic ring-hydroxylating dioxygenase subunit alpha n=1 Tax=Rhodococcus artemisiae TaxID=714159 RepID=A0ABU7LGP7_9NOCA|nr:aromatic ring-hydroxylating dioxygenase subunit alpha [Rhodococcus artemisiae]MEE2060412.1 aromatic ring-hydroxylating dioxygenase subunit alpha [Rhodococcus artemisiae]
MHSPTDPDYYLDAAGSRVRKTAYLDPDLYAAELTRIFEKTWLYVGHGSEIPNAGDYKTTTIVGRPVIVSRDRTGEVHVLQNRCRHRGASVCQAPTGNARFFRCEYHGWTYKNSGELVGVTFPDGYTDIDKPSLGLLSVPRVEVYRDFIFASLNPDAMPLLDHLAGAKEFIDLFVDAGRGKPLEADHGTHQLEYPGNWKLQLENGCDGYHPNFAHRSFFRVVGSRTGEDSSGSYLGGESKAAARSLGNGHTILDQRNSVGDHYTKRSLLAPDAEEIVEELKREVPEDELDDLLGDSVHLGFNLTVFPNLQLIGIHIREIVPVSPTQTVVKYTPMTIDGVPDGINQLRLRSHELFYSAAGFGVPDDSEMFRRVANGFGTDAEWLLMSRGLEREVTDEQHPYAHVTDELPQRAEWLHWAGLMRAGEVAVSTAGTPTVTESALDAELFAERALNEKEAVR